MYSIVYRALVTYSDSSTGDIRVKIPAVTGLSEVPLSTIGRAPSDGTWVVPEVGSQIIVSADDENMTNVFWVQTDPSILQSIQGYYGAFSDYTDQYSGGAETLEGAVANTAAPMRLTTFDEANGVSVISNSRITFRHKGLYNIQWSGQFVNTDNAPHDVSVWLRKNGVDPGVLGSTGFISLAARKNPSEFAHTISSWNYVFSVEKNDYYEFMWSTTSTTVSIQTLPVGTGPTRPSTASLIVTVTPVAQIQMGAQGPPGVDGANSILEHQIFS